MIAVAEIVVPVPEWDRDEDWDTERTHSGWCQWNASKVSKQEVFEAVLADLSADGVIPYGVAMSQCRVSRWRVVTWDDDWDDLQDYWYDRNRLAASSLYDAWRNGELHVVDKLEFWG